MAADARLRHAYADAVDAGVPRPILRDYRNRWSSLRRRAPAQPDLVTSRYHELAAELDQMASVDRHRYPRGEPSRELSWTAFRSDLQALSR